MMKTVFANDFEDVVIESIVKNMGENTALSLLRHIADSFPLYEQWELSQGGKKSEQWQKFVFTASGLSQKVTMHYRGHEGAAKFQEFITDYCIIKERLSGEENLKARGLHNEEICDEMEIAGFTRAYYYQKVIKLPHSNQMADFLYDSKTEAERKRLSTVPPSSNSPGEAKWHSAQIIMMERAIIKYEGKEVADKVKRDCERACAKFLNYLKGKGSLGA